MFCVCVYLRVYVCACVCAFACMCVNLRAFVCACDDGSRVDVIISSDVLVSVCVFVQRGLPIESTMELVDMVFTLQNR